MLKAFYYMFKDEECFFKFCGLYSLIILPIFGFIIPLIGFIMTIIAIIIMIGYSILCIRVILENDDNIKIPIMNIKNSIKLGLKYSASYFLLIFIIVCFPLLISYIYPNIDKQVIKLIFFVLIFIAYIYLTIFFPAFNLIFAKTENIYTYLQPIKALKLILQSPKSYIIAVCFTASFTFIQNLMRNNTIFTICILFILPYIFFVLNYIIAKSIKPEVINNIT